MHSICMSLVHVALCCIPVFLQTQLLAAMAPLSPRLLPEEKERNLPGDCLNYRFKPSLTFTYSSTHKAFPDVLCHAE